MPQKILLRRIFIFCFLLLLSSACYFRIGWLLVGEREAWLDGVMMDAADAHAKLGVAPLVLRPKESLAIMNGTSVMTALGCLSWMRSRRLAHLASVLTAMASDVLHGVAAHFERLVDGALHSLGQRVTWPLETRQVGEDELMAGAVGDPDHAPARRLRLVGDDRHLAAGQRVDERRLPDVRPPGDGDETAPQGPTPPPRVGMTARRPRR
jgi:hypothetical protein